MVSGIPKFIDEKNEGCLPSKNATLKKVLDEINIRNLFSDDWHNEERHTEENKRK